MTPQEMAEKLTKDLADQGKLLEAGWQTYRLLCLKKSFSDPAYDLREAFYGGAEHIFSSMINMMDPGIEETEADLTRMDLLHKELSEIRDQLRLKYGRTAGNA